MKLTDKQINAAAKKMAECMDYPWEWMPEQGKRNFREHAQAVFEAVGLAAESAEQRGQGQDVALIDECLVAIHATACTLDNFCSYFLGSCCRCGLSQDQFEQFQEMHKMAKEGVNALMDLHDQLRGLRPDHTPPPPAGVPDGWRLVPVEPTLDMGWAYLDAANASYSDKEHSFNHAGYRAMLSAAPQPAAQDIPAIFKE